MKKSVTIFLTLSSLALLVVSSCKKSDKVVTDTGSAAGSLNVSTTTPALLTSKINDTSSAVMFSFTAPKITFKSATITYTLQIDPVGDNWKSPASIAVGSSATSQGLSTAVFDKLLLKLGLVAGKSVQVNARLVNGLSSATALYSNTVTLTVTPINLTTWVYVPGDYEGWNNSSAADSLISPTSNNIYSGIINFPAGGTFQFKVVPVKGDWTVAYGDAGGGTISTSGGNLTVPAAGHYLITIDLNKNTITEVPCDFYSVTGDAATGWGNDTFMKFINDGNNNWVVKLPLVSTGAFKIRQDAQWTNSWGIPKSGTAGAGVPNTLNSTSNDNITVSASGTYTVSFNAPPSPVTVGTTSLTTTTYSVK